MTTESVEHDVLSNTSDAAVAAMWALSSADPETVDPDEIYSIITPAGATHEIVDLAHFLDHPRRKTGRVTLHDGLSFSTYVSKHKIDGATELYADVTAQTVVAVLNDDAGTDAGWRDHRAVLQLKHTEEWDTWLALDNKLVDQVTFAEHIESNSADIVDPSGATMLELAQTFQAKKDVDFKSSRLLDSGQRQLTYHEQQTASAGANGTIEIPSTLTLGIVPFEIGMPYKVTARFRYRLVDGDLKLGYKLDNANDVIREAFSELLTEIQQRTSIEVLYGTPAS